MSSTGTIDPANDIIYIYVGNECGTLNIFRLTNVNVCLLVFNVAFKHLGSYHDGAYLQQWYFDQCAATQECHTVDTGHPTPLQYTNTGPTCRCANHWCGMSHWKTQLPILLSWVRPDREFLPRPSTHTSESSTLGCCYGGSQSEAR